jgi:hypothetical protein
MKKRGLIICLKHTNNNQRNNIHRELLLKIYNNPNSTLNTHTNHLYLDKLCIYKLNHILMNLQE